MRNEQVDEHMLSLARGPKWRATYYPSYNVNGFRFHVKHREDSKSTQNSGVMVRGEDQSDSAPYYGVLTDIVELQYTEGNKIVLFKCDWYDVSREGIGYKRDRHGITSVNTSRKLNTEEPFVLAFQATQVYYVKGIKDPTWCVVIETKPRNLYEIPIYEEESYQVEGNLHHHINAPKANDEDDDLDWNRNEVEI